MKCIYTEELKKLIEVVAHNGSHIAKLILKDMEEAPEMTSEQNLNYLDVKYITENNRKEVRFTGCNKDIHNPKFPDKSPDAMWKEQNRIEFTKLDFFFSRFNSVRDLFWNCQKDDTLNKMRMETQFFAELLPFPKLYIKELDTEEGIVFGYDGSNYCKHNNQSTLHNSCMRDDVSSPICGNFYKHVCNCKLLVVVDDLNNIYGRALIWPNVHFDYLSQKATLLDRCYTASEVINKMMRNYAAEKGYITKEINSYDSKTQFKFWNNDKWETFKCIATVQISQSDEYSNGVPYLDTFSFLNYKDNKLYLSNKQYSWTLGRLDITSHYVTLSQIICPICGEPTDLKQKICDECFKKYFISPKSKFLDDIYILNPEIGDVKDHLMDILQEKKTSPILKTLNFLDKLSSHE